MLAYSQFHNPIEFGAGNLTLLDFLRTARMTSVRLQSRVHLVMHSIWCDLRLIVFVSQKDRLVTKTIHSAPVANKCIAVEATAAQQKLKKTVRFSETVYVRTFRQRPVEPEPIVEPELTSIKVSEDSVKLDLVPVFRFPAAAASSDQVSFQQAPYFQAFEASMGLTTLPPHYRVWVYWRCKLFSESLLTLQVLSMLLKSGVGSFCFTFIN